MATTQIHSQKHPNYLGIFWLLAGLTGLEIGVTYFPIPQAPILLTLAGLKAVLVAMFYMHLKFDSKVFRYIFLFGLLMGLLLIISFLLLFR